MLSSLSKVTKISHKTIFHSPHVDSAAEVKGSGVNLLACPKTLTEIPMVQQLAGTLLKLILTKEGTTFFLDTFLYLEQRNNSEPAEYQNGFCFL